MRFFFNSLFFCVVVLVPPALADFTRADSAKALAHCQGKPFIGATVFVENRNEASSKTKTEITRKIISQVESQIKISDSSEEIGGVLTESSSYSGISQIKSNLTLFGFQEIESPKLLESGEYEFKGYVCNHDAAKPYLDSLDKIERQLSTRKVVSVSSCQEFYKEYSARVMLFEGLLERFGQKDKGKVGNYRKIEKNCKQVGKGIFLKNNPEASELSKDFAKALGSKIPFKISGECLQGIKVQARATDRGCKENRMGGYIECTTDVYLEVEECGSTKTYTLDGKISDRASRADAEERARQGMLNKLRNCNFLKFDAWKKELQPWMEK
ncbi:MAG: hypothetical protein LBU89_09925 [Fibromonadaceae bacterium]|jgi:hypothetical protein|nr:hypothetical protein [Fibromonadaceae bacterium]